MQQQAVLAAGMQLLSRLICAPDSLPQFPAGSVGTEQHCSKPTCSKFLSSRSSGVILSEETRRCCEEGSSVQSGISNLLLEPGGGSLAVPVPLRDWEDALFLPD